MNDHGTITITSTLTRNRADILGGLPLTAVSMIIIPS
jgi:hypothetical protein